MMSHRNFTPVAPASDIPLFILGLPIAGNIVGYRMLFVNGDQRGTGRTIGAGIIFLITGK